MEFYKASLLVRQRLQLWLERDIELRGKIKKIVEDPGPISIDDLPECTIGPNGKLVPVPGTGSKREPTVKTVIEHSHAPFPEGDREYLLNLSREMMGYIMRANTVYVGHNCRPENIGIRVGLQTKAIGCLAAITEELLELEAILPFDLNRIENILEAADNADSLLRKWRNSDSRRKV